MLLLHVWGDETGVSVISPECLAASWILAGFAEEYEVVTSSNTNLSDTRRLPVLYADDGTKQHGYLEIARFLTGRPPCLNELALMDACLEQLHIIHLYNLYVSPSNYTQFTRKQFQKYLPFPMMYNQPLKFHAEALAHVESVGLGAMSTSFFSMGTTNKVPSTELVPGSSSDEEEDIDEPISGLHERLLIAKTKVSSSLRESKNIMRCSRLLSRYIKGILNIYRHLNEETETEFGFLVKGGSPCPGEILFYAYISCLLGPYPDKAMLLTLRTGYPKMVDFIESQVTQFEALLKDKGTRGPIGREVPGLFNQIKFISGVLKY